MSRPGPDPQPGPGSGGGRRGRGTFTVGIVEDHPTTRAGVVATLVSSGFNVVQAVACTEDLTITPDVVLCDLGLPDGCRQEEAAIAWLTGRGGTVVAFSQLATARAQLAALATGAQGFVHKAAEAGELAAAVDTAAAGGHWIGPQLAGWLLLDLREARARAAGDVAGQLAVLRALSQGYAPAEYDARQHVVPGTAARLLAEAVEGYRIRARQYQPSPREAEVITCVADLGLTVPDTAARLGMAERTVRSHLESIKDKYRRADPTAHPRLTPVMAAILWSQRWDGRPPASPPGR